MVEQVGKRRNTSRERRFKRTGSGGSPFLRVFTLKVLVSQYAVGSQESIALRTSSSMWSSMTVRYPL